MKTPPDGVLEAAREHLVEKIASEKAYLKILEQQLRGLTAPGTRDPRVGEKPK